MNVRKLKEMVCNLWRLFEQEEEENMVYNIKWKDMKGRSNLDIEASLWDLLTRIDNYCGNKLYVHRLTDKTTRKTSQHYIGKAADVHIDGLHVLDQYVLAERFDVKGLGVYPKDVWTYTPGLHIDVRTTDIGKRWGYKGDNGSRIMVALGRDFFEHVLNLD